MLTSTRVIAILEKVAARRERHEVTRLRERTRLQRADLSDLRRRVRRRQARLRPGSAYVRMRDGSYAALKDVGQRHVVATFLANYMRPRGEDATELVFGGTRGKGRRQERRP